MSTIITTSGEHISLEEIKQVLSNTTEALTNAILHAQAKNHWTPGDLHGRSETIREAEELLKKL